MNKFLISQFFLTGSDNFHLQLDQLMVETSATNNVCHLSIELDSNVNVKRIKEVMSASELYTWITRLRLKQSFLPFLMYKWQLKERLDVPKIDILFITETELENNGFLGRKTLDCRREAPFWIKIINVDSKKKYVIFGWHHSLMDAHGGELFIQYLVGKKSRIDDQSLLFSKNEESRLKLRQKSEIALQMKENLYQVSLLPILSLSKKTKSNPNLRYKTILFNIQQTMDILSVAKQNQAGYLISAFYLACTACSVAEIQKIRNHQLEDILVPVPHDRRKKGADGPVFGNPISFLFYRLSKNHLQDIQECTEDIIEQMKSMIRTNSPLQYNVMLDFIRWLPGLVYRKLLKNPSKGQMASFYFSDTGESLSAFKELFDMDTNQAIHFPPIMYPPGITFVFSRFNQQLQITLGYMDDVLTVKEVETLSELLTSKLLGKKH